MAFDYHFSRNEANFGKPLKRQVKGGAHVTFEIIPTYRGKAVAFLRQSVPGHEKPPIAKSHPEGVWFFCHNLIRFAEPFGTFVNRVVKAQTGVGITRYRVVDFESFFQDKDDHWALLGYVVAELKKLPTAGVHGNRLHEVRAFTQKNIPKPFGWWTTSEVKSFLEKNKAT